MQGDPLVWATDQGKLASNPNARALGQLIAGSATLGLGADDIAARWLRPTYAPRDRVGHPLLGEGRVIAVDLLPIDAPEHEPRIEWLDIEWNDGRVLRMAARLFPFVKLTDGRHLRRVEEVEP